MKTKLLLRLWLLAIMLCPSIGASAYEAQIDGIYYDFEVDYDTKEKIAIVTYQNHGRNYESDYSGSVTIPATVKYLGSTYSVKRIDDHAFEGCTGLTSVTIRSGVTWIGMEAFNRCSGLTSVTIPNSVTVIGGGAFSFCTALTSIRIPNSVLLIGQEAFNGCSGLTSVTIGTGLIETEDPIFIGCTSITSVSINCKEIGIWFKGMKSIKEISIGKNVTSICDEAFSGCNGITSLTIPNNVTSIGDNTFYGCSGITSVSINCEIRDWIYAMENIKEITIGKNVTQILLSGKGLYKREKIVVEEGNTVYDSRNNCNAIIITEDNLLYVGSNKTVIPESVTSIATSAFYFCTGLTSIDIPNSVTSIGDAAFSGCIGLTSIDIPNSVTSIGYAAFEGCIGLTAINIPNSVTIIEGRAFSRCTGLTAISIPNSVNMIDRAVFIGCISLTSVTIPESVNEIDMYAFSGCKNLKDVYCYSEDVPACMTGCFDEVPLADATLHVPYSSLGAYRTHDYWKKFGRIVSITDAVNNIPDNVAPEIIAVYDINGRRQPNMQKGLNIVKYSNGNIKKVLK